MLENYLALYFALDHMHARLPALVNLLVTNKAQREARGVNSYTLYLASRGFLQECNTGSRTPVLRSLISLGSACYADTQKAVFPVSAMYSNSYIIRVREDPVPIVENPYGNPIAVVKTMLKTRDPAYRFVVILHRHHTVGYRSLCKLMSLQLHRVTLAYQLAAKPEEILID